ncbi:MAG: phosphate acyltransferase PlsX [Bacteroidota bacterium]
MKLALDIPGGDFAPSSTLEGAIMASQKLPSETLLVLVGDAVLIEDGLSQRNADLSRFEVIHAPDVIAMSEHPAKAFVKKPASSIAVGFSLLKEGKVQAFSSCGNTGAMLVGAVQVLKAVPGVIRPCITTVMPKLTGGMGIILDVGTNADCKPDVLYQFGILGSLFAEHVYHISNPRVGLINIGEEQEKGNLVAQAAHQLMKDSTDFNFIGNVEGRDILSDAADVYVCEGFTGNVILKEAEAFYTAIRKRGIKDAFFDRFNYELYGGTPILGINSTVMIGHGMSSPLAICNMLLLSAEVASSGLSQKIHNAFQP